MKHLNFVEELRSLGITISKTIENEFQLKWKERSIDNPLEVLLKKAVDAGKWEHSWHIEMTPYNYEKIEDIIQKRIIGRAKEINQLMSIYFQLRYEMSQLEIEEK